MPEAVLYQGDVVNFDYTPTAATTGGAVVQLANGLAGVVPVDLAASELGSAAVEGVFTLDKAASVFLAAGDPVYWDHSANVATFRPVNDRDFFVGTATADASASGTSVTVNLNQAPVYALDALRDGALSVATGTAAAGGFGLPQVVGGARQLTLTATNEAQCVDILSVDRRAVTSKWIFDAVVRLAANGSSNAVDINVGVANGTSTTDADAIAESAFFHIDGGALDILAESDDGTNEVTATDTTVDATAGSAVANRLYLKIDGRDPASLRYYINGARVLSATTFNVSAATGPIGLLAHVEKTSGTATATVVIDQLTLRTCE